MPEDIREYQNVERLIALFDGLFLGPYNTRLCRGGAEPLYIPAHNRAPHEIHFAHGFFNSALHEVAHWCIAGPERRLLEDFGYWYEPDGRSEAQQRQFEGVEVKPQALEWIFCLSAGRPFRLSVDNLSGSDQGTYDIQPFASAVHQEVQRRLQEGLPSRARLFSNALITEFNPGWRLVNGEFCREALVL